MFSEQLYDSSVDDYYIMIISIIMCKLDFSQTERKNLTFFSFDATFKYLITLCLVPIDRYCSTEDFDT